MKNMIVPPNGDWIDVGPYMDDTGEKFVSIQFSDPDHDGVVVTFSEAFFHAFVRHLVMVAGKLEDTKLWEQAADAARRDRSRS